jgi:hypothetical protein
MRHIQTSTDVYAAIWAARQPGEDNEDSILRRLLNIPAGKGAAAIPEEQAVGFRETRFDITFPDGFEIYRRYKGTEYRARASGGLWRLDANGHAYGSINQLSRATSGNVENAWRNWNFTGKDGKSYKIEKLRNDITPNVRHLL